MGLKYAGLNLYKARHLLYFYQTTLSSQTTNYSAPTMPVERKNQKKSSKITPAMESHRRRLTFESSSSEESDEPMAVDVPPLITVKPKKRGTKNADSAPALETQNSVDPKPIEECMDEDAARIGTEGNFCTS